MSGVAIENAGVDVPEKLGGSRSKRSQDIRASHFVMDERQRTTTRAYACHHIKLWLHVQFLQRSARTAGNSKVVLAKIAHVTMA